jgi:hypothetical protein
MAGTLSVPETTVVGGSSSPWTVPQLWDTLFIGGIGYGPLANEVSGKVRIRGAERFYRLDTKAPQGADGATTTYRGLKPKKFAIVFHIWTQPQYDYFTNSVLPVLFYSGVKNASNPSGVQSLAVSHPILDNLNISAVEVEAIGGIEPTQDGPGMFECRIEVQEYIPNPPVNVTVTPSGSKNVNQPTAPGRVPSPAIAKNNAAIDARRAQIAAAGGTPIL